jgi:hypothetical protein
MSTGGLLSLLASVGKLDASNYNTWSFDIRQVLEQAELWPVTIGSVTQPASGPERAEWIAKSGKAYNWISLTVGLEQRVTIVGLVDQANRGPAAWEALLVRNASNTTVARVEIKRRMYSTRHDHTKPISEYISKIISCGHELRGIGVAVGPTDVQDVILANLPPSFASYGSSIMLQPGNISIEALSRLLVEYEKQMQESFASEPGAIAAFARRSGGSKFGKGSSSTAGGSSGAGGDGDEGKKSRGRRGGKIRCFRCKEYGNHYADKCPAPAPVDSSDDEEKAGAAFAYPGILQA